MKTNFLQAQLQTGSYIPLAISQLPLRFAWRAKCSAELFRKYLTNDGRALVPGHVNPFSMMTKIFEIQAKAASIFRADDIAELFHKSRMAIRSEAHHFSLIAIMQKAEKLRCSGVQYACRVWILNLSQ